MEAVTAKVQVGGSTFGRELKKLVRSLGVKGVWGMEG